MSIQRYFLLHNRLQVLLIIVAAASLTLSIVAVASVQSFSSDDVSQQNAFAAIKIGESGSLHLPQNNYLIKAPLYFIESKLALDPESQLIIASLLLNAASILFIFFSMKSFSRLFGLRNQLLIFIPLIWLCTLGGSFVGTLINPNSRNLEIGLAFSAGACLANWYYGKWVLDSAKSRVIAGFFIVGLGLLIFDDPYFGYVLALPLVVVFGLKSLLDSKDKKAPLLVVAILASLICAIIWGSAFWLIGVHVDQATGSFATPSQLGANLQLLLSGTINLFNANIFGQSIISAQSLGTEINFLILLVITLSPILLLFSKTVRSDIWKVFLVLQPLFGSVVFVMNGMVFGTGSERYLIILPFYVATIFLVAIAEHMNIRLLTASATILLVASAFNLFSSVKVYASRDGSPNSLNQHIASVAAANGLTKGYATYWDAGINQYFSGERTYFIQAGCSPKIGVILNQSLLNLQELKRPSSKSFYLYDPASTRCTIVDLRKFLGPPEKQISLPNNMSFLVYDYDITARVRRY